MNRYAESRWLHPLAILLVAVLASGCAGLRTSDDGAATAAETPEAAVEPAADLGDPEARFAEALEFMRTRQSTEAVAAFIALTRDFPEFSGPHTNLGILYAQANRRSDAMSAFSRAIELNAGNVVAHNWLGTLHREAGNYPRAREAFEKALAIDPNYAAARLNLGLLYDDHLKQPGEALAQYREYYRVTDGTDLRVLPWIGEIEAQQAAQTEASAPAAAAEEDVK